MYSVAADLRGAGYFVSAVSDRPALTKSDGYQEERTVRSQVCRTQRREDDSLQVQVVSSGQDEGAPTEGRLRKGVSDQPDEGS